MDHLANMNVVTVSGAAYGIDGLVHTLSVKKNIPTIAVPGSGIDDESFYPRAHLELKHEIIDNGGLIMSEFDPLARAGHWTFPIRNRIMAGMSHVVIVVEAEKRSGTLITAHLGVDYGREVIAVPGSIFSHTSAGTHELIRHGATLLSSLDALTETLTVLAKREGINLWKEDFETKNDINPNTLMAAISKLSPEERTVYTCIQSYSDGLEKTKIQELLNMTSGEVSILVSLLELEDLVYIRLGKVQARIVPQ